MNPNSNIIILAGQTNKSSEIMLISLIIKL